ncbi:hypothetical protein [Halocatena pleomorpha]|uniref:Uncharacterized protein n=1 Tax=Halocatena pleomorpha TaxID=1785090 RepID=A0A3P3RBF0_9EURY|nr:hypothetical protein [Halocatena pleomorpha]RRJ30268.1 hypothetical protein EIK79_10110 [Halocatena pleomorpha]
MTDEWMYIVAVVGIGVAFLVGLFLNQALSTLIVLVSLISSLGALYLGLRFVQAVERIADSLERGELSTDRSEPSPENRS